MEFENSKSVDKRGITKKRFTYADSDDMVGAYYCDSTHDLLSVEQETKLTRRLTVGRSFVGNRDLDHIVLTDDAKDAFDTLVAMNLRLVNDVVEHYLNRGVEQLDLIQAGSIGLMRATAKFDIDFGFRFSTYATWWIRQAVTREIADHGRTIRIPVKQSDTINKLEKVYALLTQKLGREAKAEEIAEYLNIDPKKVELLFQQNTIPVSLDIKIDEEDSDGANFGDYVEDKNTQVEAESENNLLKEKVKETFEKYIKYKPRLALVLGFRYGLIDGNYYSLDEIGEKIGLTSERVRQLEIASLREMSKRLKEYTNYVFDK